MADQKITDLPALTALAAADLLEVVDVSDTSLAASGTNKQITALDLLGILFTGGDVPITGAATATIGRVHLCVDAGTPADYTLTLPAIGGNDGKLLAVIIDDSVTKLVTLDGTSSETIDGALTRVMWAGEVAILQVIAGEWKKIAGSTIPMSVTAKRSGSDQSGSGGVWTDVVLDNFVGGHASMWDSGNGWVQVVRPGRYHANGFVYVSSAATFGYMTADFNSSLFQQIVNASGILAGAVSTIVESAAVGDHFTVSVFAPNSILIAATVAPVKVSLVEIPSW